MTRTPKNDGFLMYVRNSSANAKLNLYNIDAQGNRTNLVEVAGEYDPRKRPWYQAVRTAGRSIWSEVYLDFTTLQPTITASQPVYAQSDQEVLGVCGTDVILFEDFHGFLANLKIGKTG